VKTFDARTVERWRKWLAAHHASESEVWLVFHKKHTGRACVVYGDAVDEALCVGWIDSLVKRIDEARYALKFTPRKPDSKWSASNRKRYAALHASGRLKPAGLRRAPTDRTYDRPPRRPSLASTVPRYIEKALKGDRAAWNYFSQLAPSHRRQYIVWIDWAKRQDTKDRRLREAIRLLHANQKLGLK
jgi:uncharacterized protein YdeI (YjbR/CyaY-like superfamily)